MQAPSNAYEFLEELGRRKGKQAQNYRSLSTYLNFKAREKGVPIFGQFELTPLCNFRCRMCYVQLDADQLGGRKILPASVWKDLIHQAWEAGMLHVTLTGGECLAYPEFDEVFLYLLSLGCEPAILTNGFLLDDSRIEFFRKHRPSMIQVSLYGWNDDVYERVTGRRAFTTVAENVRKAIAAGLHVKLVVTPNRYLGEDIFETIRFGKTLTRDCSPNTELFTPREETGRSQQQDDVDTDLYIRIFRLMMELDGEETREIDPDKLPPAGGPYHECDECGLDCGGGRSGFVINWKGTLMPCNRLDGIQAEPLEYGFREAWDRIHREAMKWPRVPECIGCAYRGICNTCAATMLKYAEPGKQPTGMCELVKRYVSHGVMRVPDCE